MRVGDEAERCLPELEAWVAKNLPKSYRWPGNYRELEQCVRNFVIRGSYRPLDRQPGKKPPAEREWTAAPLKRKSRAT